jgi:hypothetical protein
MKKLSLIQGLTNFQNGGGNYKNCNFSPYVLP